MPRAVICERIGPYDEVLRFGEAPPLQPIPEDTLHVRVACAGLGFPDLLQVEGKYQTKATPPFVPVNYLAGEILAVGPGVEGWQAGDRIVGSAALSSSGQLCGGLAEEALVKVSHVSRVPDFIDFQVALAMHENYWDVNHAVSVCGQVSAADTLLVLGASGACGLAAIDLGTALGARVVACASTPEKLGMCKQQGADVVVDYDSGGADAFIATLKEQKLYGKITVIFDPVGGRYGETAFRSLAPGGRYVVFGFASGGINPKSAFPNFPINLLLMKGQQIIGSMGTTRGEQVAEMYDMVKDGRLKPLTSKSYPFDEFAAAFSDLANRKAIGKVVVDVRASSRSKL